jgi:hypothetical protein
LEIEMKPHKIASLALIAGLIAAAALPAEARPSRVGGRTGNGTAGAVGSANGNIWARGHTTRTNPDGSKTAVSGGAFSGANGSAGARASTTTVNPDGSATRQGGFAAQGPRGSASSQGNGTRNADGTYTANRTSNGTNAATGNSYNGSASYDSANGASRTATCTNASGAEIACPSAK